MSNKKCPQCNLTKPSSGFGSNASRKDGLQSICKDCRKSNATKWYSTNKPIQAARNEKVRRSKGIPVRKRVLLDSNIMKEWHPTKNKEIDTSSLSGGSKLKVWWQCEKGHEWQATLNNRHFSKTLCPQCRRALGLSGINNNLEQNAPLLVEQWHPTKNKDLNPKNLSLGSKLKVWWQCEKGHEWQAHIYARGRGTSCPYCNGNRSGAEKEITNLLREYGLEVVTNSRSLIPNREIDIFLPSKNIAIEFNGIYWHTESAGKDRNYHYDKWLKCNEVGIQLLQVWEDDWNKNKNLILEMILNKVGLKNKDKIFARNTKTSIIPSGEARMFLDKNHIQGFASGSIYVGLKTSDEELVAVMSLKKTAMQNEAYDIVRYATSKKVLGGFTKIISFIDKTYDVKTYTTFSDNTVSDGSLYRENGFILDKHIPPDYSYAVKGQRIHKFNYRLKRFRNDLNLEYVEGYSEAQLAIINNIPRIWDAGKIRWVKEN